MLTWAPTPGNVDSQSSSCPNQSAFCVVQSSLLSTWLLAWSEWLLQVLGRQGARQRQMKNLQLKQQQVHLLSKSMAQRKTPQLPKHLEHWERQQRKPLAVVSMEKAWDLVRAN